MLTIPRKKLIILNNHKILRLKAFGQEKEAFVDSERDHSIRGWLF